MSYKQAIFANQEFYHVFNRGVEKRITFMSKRDYLRFIETINYYRFRNPPVRFSFRNRKTLKSNSKLDSSVGAEIICFCLMPNHFHMLLRQIENKGITNFVSKITNSYTKYFNTLYDRVGPLFQGNFKAVRIEDDEQLFHVSRYIHLNPLIDYLTKDLKTYLYSSYLEYLGNDNGICQKDYILSTFSKNNTYEQFVLAQEEYGRTIKNIERLLLEEQKY